MTITNLQRVVLIITALGLAFHLISLIQVPLPYYMIWPVWAVLGFIVFLALFPTKEK